MFLIVFTAIFFMGANCAAHFAAGATTLDQFDLQGN
jgi:hypothetical protein